MGEMAFQVGKGLQNLPGSVPPRKHKLHRSNIEQEENERMTEKRLAGVFEKFPMHTHKAGGLVRIVENEDQLADALAKGWKADIREVAQPLAMPERISEMTVAQADEFIRSHAGNAAKVSEMIADEQSHGNRAAVMALLEAAADAIDAPSKAPDVPKAKAKR